MAKIYLNEVQLYNYIRNKVQRLCEDIFSDDNQNTENDTTSSEMGKGIDPNNPLKNAMSFIYHAFSSKQKAKYLEIIYKKLELIRGMADKYGFEVRWNIKQIKVSQNNPEEVKIKLDIQFSSDSFQIEGYEFIAAVYPIVSANISEEEDKITSYSLVVPCSSINSNNDLISELSHIASNAECDGCHSKRDRGAYFIFRDEKDNSIKKFGSTCAKKYFGIDFGAKFKKILKSLNAGSDMISFDKLTQHSILDRFKLTAITTIMLINEEGVLTTRIKNNPRFHELYDIADKINRQTYDRNYNTDKESEVEKQNSKKFYLATDTFYNIISFLPEFINHLENDFERLNDFQEAMKVHAAIMYNGSTTRQASKYFRSGIVPYVILEAYKYKYSQNNEIKKLEPFEGRQELEVKIKNITRSTSYYGDYDYYDYTAETNEGAIVKWKTERPLENVKAGNIVKISAEYYDESRDGISTLLNRVELSGMGEEAQPVEIEYPQDGFRYKNNTFTFLRVRDDFFEVQSEEGCKYFISNIQRNYYSGEESFKFREIMDNFKDGDSINLTGTVKSYNNRKGGVGHKLERVKFDPSIIEELRNKDIEELRKKEKERRLKNLEYVTDFIDGVAVFRNGVDRINGKVEILFNLVDQNGNILLDKPYAHVNTFKNGYACFGDGREGYNFIDRNGNLFSDVWFQNALDFDYEDGKALVMYNDMVYLLSKNGDLYDKKSNKIVGNVRSNN